jgi:hypothetical protein
MVEGRNIGAGAVGFVAGLVQALERINQQNRQEQLQLLQLGQSSGRFELAPAANLQAAPFLQRLIGGSPYQAQGGQPVVPFGSGGGAVTLRPRPTIGELSPQQLSAFGFGETIDEGTRQVLSSIPFTAETAQEFSRIALANKREDAILKRTEIADRRKMRRGLQAELAKIKPETPEQRQRLEAARILLGSADETDSTAFEDAMRIAQQAATPELIPIQTPEGTFLETPKEARKIRADEEKAKLSAEREERMTKISEANLAVSRAGLALRREEARRPNTVDLALRAARGDKEAAAAVEILKPGLSIETNADGRIKSVTMGGKFPQVAVNDAVRVTTAVKDTFTLTNELRSIIEKNPGAIGLKGRINLELSNLGANLAGTITAQDDATRTRLSRLKNPTADISTAEYLSELLIYSIARQNDPNGRVAESDYASAARALGTGKRLASAQDVLPRLDAIEKLSRAKYEDAALVLRQKGLDVPALPANRRNQAEEDLKNLGIPLPQ